MARMLPDPTFYPSPAMAGEAPAETLAYVALLATGDNGKTDALGVVDTNPDSPEYGRQVSRVDFPEGGNELHHFGWKMTQGGRFGPRNDAEGETGGARAREDATD